MKMVSYWEDEIPEPDEKRKAELRALAERPDSEIDCSDQPELDDEFWEKSVLWKDLVRSDLYKPKKVTVTAKLDADVVQWLKRQGRGYQTRMNAILRHAMLQSHRTEG